MLFIVVPVERNVQSTLGRLTIGMECNVCQDKMQCIENRWWENESLLRFSSPTTIMLNGCTQSGKTFFTKKLLENANGMFTIIPKKIVYAYSEYQPLFDEMKRTIPNIIFHRGLPTREDLENYSEGLDHTILVLDDLMLQITRSEESVQLFTVTSHHRNITIMFLTQSLYPPGKYAKSITLNCTNVILFRNDRDKRQALTFASQVLPGQTDYFRDALEKTSRERYGYLLLDCSPHSERTYMLRTHIFPSEDTVVYLPRI